MIIVCRYTNETMCGQGVYCSIYLILTVNIVFCLNGLSKASSV